MMVFTYVTCINKYKWIIQWHSYWQTEEWIQTLKLTHATENKITLTHTHWAHSKEATAMEDNIQIWTNYLK